MRTPLALWLILGISSAQAQTNELVDRLSERLDAGLAGATEAEHLREYPPASPEGERATVMAARMIGPERVALDVVMPGTGPRLLLVDASTILLAPDGAGYAPVPFQRYILDAEKKTVEVEVLPLSGTSTAPPAGTPLKAAWSNDPGLIAVLRTLQQLEAVDTERVSRYVKPDGDGFKVDTFLDNQDVTLARWMTWSRNIANRIEGRFPRDGLRFAVLAVTEGYGIQETADWLRLNRKLEMNAAIAAAWDVAKQTEFLLERAGLNHRVFSPNYADYHFNQGVAAYHKNDLEKAQKSFEQASKLNPDLVEARYNLAVAQYRAGNYDGAATTLLIASGMKDASADVFYNRGAVLFRKGDKEGAARAFREALARNERDPQAGEWLAIADPEDKTKPQPAKPEKRRGKKGRKRK